MDQQGQCVLLGVMIPSEKCWFKVDLICSSLSQTETVEEPIEEDEAAAEAEKEDATEDEAEVEEEDEDKEKPKTKKVK